MQKPLIVKDLQRGCDLRKILPEKELVAGDAGVFQPMGRLTMLEQRGKRFTLSKIEHEVEPRVVEASLQQSSNRGRRAGIAAQPIEMADFVLPQSA